jgi:hypothetical protein
MFGVGVVELIVLLLVGLVMFGLPLALIGLVVWLVVKKR